MIDGSAGLWCVNAGHGRKQIAAAVERLCALVPDRASDCVRLAERLAIAPGGRDRIFFANSGSESVDTALKIALACRSSRAPSCAELRKC